MFFSGNCSYSLEAKKDVKNEIHSSYQMHECNLRHKILSEIHLNTACKSAGLKFDTKCCFDCFVFTGVG